MAVERPGRLRGRVGSPPALRIELLGGFRVFVGERAVDAGAWWLRRASSVLQLLALATGHAVAREVLVDRLWPDAAGLTGRNSLYQTLTVARHALASAGEGDCRSAWLRGDPLRLSDGPVETDVGAFEAAARLADSARCADAYARAIDLYAGDLLPDDRLDEAIAFRREALRRTFAGLLLATGRLHEHRDETDAAMSQYRRLLEVDAAHEEAHQGLMRLLARQGQRQSALRQFERLADALGRELDAEPSESSRRLRAAILAGRLPVRTRPHATAAEPNRGAAAASARGFLLNGDPPAPDIRPLPLPAEVSRFIGRTRELAEVPAKLASARLVTLVGAGGCGKTRLAREVARALAPAFGGAVAMAELAAVGEPEGVAPALAASLGLPGLPETDPLGALAAALRGRRCLLVLDNCEHLLDSSSRVAVSLLQRCPDLRILATSREALGVPGEERYRVPSLELPPTDTDRLPPGGLATALLASEAGRFFADRAAAASPGFAITPANAAAVEAVCRRLDGIPLALELAAARVEAMPVDLLAARLDDSLGLLTAGNRAAAPRHRTLRRAIEWSNALLDAEERATLRRLAVFVGGCTVAAIGAVLGPAPSAPAPAPRLAPPDPPRPPTPAPEPTVADPVATVARLVDKSLVQVVPGPDGCPRYRLLETIRQYAAAQLDAAGETATLRHRHLDYWLSWANTVISVPNRINNLPTEQSERYAADLPNIRAAFAWGVSAGRARELLWLVRGHSTLCLRTSAYTTALRLLETWLTLPETADLAALRSSACHSAGRIAHHAGDYASAERHHDEAVALARRLNNRWLESMVMYHQGATKHALGDAAAAARLYDASLDLATRYGGPTAPLYALVLYGVRLERACIAAWGTVNPDWFGYRAGHGGAFAPAAEQLRDALEVARAAALPEALVRSHRMLARVSLELGDHTGAAAHAAAALDQHAAVHSVEESAATFRVAGDVDRARQDFDGARRHYEASLRHIRDLDRRVWHVPRVGRLAPVLYGLGLALVRTGECSVAGARLAEGLAACRETVDEPGLAHLLHAIGVFASAAGHHRTAARLMALAQAHLADIEYRHARVETAEFERDLAGVAEALGPAAFADAVEAGRTLPVARAFDLALDTLAAAATDAPGGV